MTHTPIDIAALEALYQQAYKDWPGSIEQIGVARRQFTDALITAAPELFKAAKERGTTNPCNKIFDHKWLSPECVETGCKSLLLTQRAERAEELADKYKWQVRDTCTRAEKAEAALASLRALLAKVGEALEQARDCIRNETPEDMSHDEARDDTIYKIRDALASIQSALREIPTSDAKPFDFP